MRPVKGQGINAVKFLGWLKKFGPAQNILGPVKGQGKGISARQNDDLHSVKLFFCDGTKVFEEALNAVKFLDWLKKIGPAQNILGPVKGQGITLQKLQI